MGTKKSSSYSAHRLRTLEDGWIQAGYKLRYERIHFPSAYCLLHKQKTLVVSRFLSRKDRIDVLLMLQEQLKAVAAKP